MAYEALTANEVAVGAPITSALWTKVKNDLDFLNGELGAVAVDQSLLNGSFETDSDDDGDPDNWTIENYTGGAHGLSSTNHSHGLWCLYFTHPGGVSNGGGHAVSDYFFISSRRRCALTWDMFCTAAGMKVTVGVLWYDESQTYISTTIAYTSTANPVAWTTVTTEYMTPPTNAVYCKLDLVGGYTDTNVAGTCVFDNVSFSQRFTRQVVYGAVAIPAGANNYFALSGGGVVSNNTVGGIRWLHGFYAMGLLLNTDNHITATVVRNGNYTAMSATGNNTNYANSFHGNYFDALCMHFTNSDANNAYQATWAIGVEQPVF